MTAPRALFVVSAHVLLLSHTVALAATKVTRASSAGAHLDSSLLKGGGTDDTAALQAVLNRAADGAPVELLIDGAALVRGLDVYGNTTIECIQGGGLYLKDGSDRALVRNAHRSRDAVEDEHIAIRGCFLNGNRDHQSDTISAPFPTYCRTLESDGTPTAGLQFFGVKDVAVADVTLWHFFARGAIFSNASRIDIRNVTVDHGDASDDIHINYGCTGGIRFDGPVRDATVEGAKIRMGDDAFPIFADSQAGPYEKGGPITDLTISNVVLMDSVSGFRLVSNKHRIDRVLVHNVSGTINGWFVVGISHFTTPGRGDIGSITLDTVSVSRAAHDGPMAAEVAANVRQDNEKAEMKEFNSGVFPLINVNGRVENLILHNIVTEVRDGRPILRIGPDSDVQIITANLSLYDPKLQGMPVQIDEHAHVGRFNLSVDWQSESVDRSKAPIQNGGAVIGQLNWIKTPPMFVAGVLEGQRTVVVTFSQDIKALDFSSGVRIAAAGRPLVVSSASRDKGRPDSVRYVLKARPPVGAIVTWAYVEAIGNIQNWSGNQLHSVPEKLITYETHRR